MFKKKKDEWIIGYDDFLEETEFSEPSKTKKRKPPKNQYNRKKTKREKTIENSCDSTDDNSSSDLYNEYEIPKRKPNPLKQRDIDAYSYDSYGDDEIIMESELGIPKWIIILIASIVSLCILIGMGYFNTDFDNNGKAYIIPLQIHYERAYTKSSDKLLESILEMNKTFEEDTKELSHNYIEKSYKLTEDLNLLKKETTKFSKYVGVPTQFKSYHNQLINFSLSTQSLIEKLLKNYNDPNYESFREKALDDYYLSLEKVKQARSDIDVIIFRNMEVD